MESRTLLSQAKTLGGVGSILLLLTFAPYVGMVLAVVGLVLILVAVSRIADAVRDRLIYRNAILAVVLGIAGVLVGGLVIFAAVFRVLGLGFLAGLDLNPITTPADFWGLITALVLGLLAMWVFYLVSAVFLKRACDAISTRLNVRTFHTAALLYLVGAVLAVVVVGFALIFVAQILFVVAFFSIPAEAPRTAAVPA